MCSRIVRVRSSWKSGPYDGCVNAREASGVGLGGLVVDWGGVLTASLDGAMAGWAQRDAVEYEHFRDVMRAWVRRPGAGGPDDGRAGGEALAGGGMVDVLTGRSTLPDGGFGDGSVADLEQVTDAGPAGQSPVHRLERGEISVPDFEHELAEALAGRGSVVPAEGLLGRMFAGLAGLDEEMLGLVRRARARGIRTALLSNSWGDHYPEQLWDGLFDAVVISGRVGMRKPEPEIFRYTCEQLQLPPSRCVMVDDLPHNVCGAVAVGMVAVQHRTYAETAGELEILFDVPLR
jgi:HAD superfamily hydrolase (TIGR01509 family)